MTGSHFWLLGYKSLCQDRQFPPPQVLQLQCQTHIAIYPSELDRIERELRETMTAVESIIPEDGECDVCLLRQHEDQ